VAAKKGGGVVDLAGKDQERGAKTTHRKERGNEVVEGKIPRNASKKKKKKTWACPAARREEKKIGPRWWPASAQEKKKKPVVGKKKNTKNAGKGGPEKKRGDLAVETEKKVPCPRQEKKGPTCGVG